MPYINEGRMANKSNEFLAALPWTFKTFPDSFISPFRAAWLSFGAESAMLLCVNAFVKLLNLSTREDLNLSHVHSMEIFLLALLTNNELWDDTAKQNAEALHPLLLLLWAVLIIIIVQSTVSIPHFWVWPYLCPLCRSVNTCQVIYLNCILNFQTTIVFLSTSEIALSCFLGHRHAHCGFNRPLWYSSEWHILTSLYCDFR